jgi:hypothetical protein
VKVRIGGGGWGKKEYRLAGTQNELLVIFLNNSIKGGIKLESIHYCIHVKIKNSKKKNLFLFN